jgi:hypothetical protein
MVDKKKLLEVCESQEGYHEKASNKDLDSKTGNAGSKNYTKYAKFFDDLRKQGIYVFNYEKNPVQWCAVYAIYCFCMAYGVENAMKMLFLPSRSSAASASEFAKYFKSHKAFKSTPDVGDVIFFKQGHAGIVIKVTEKMVYTNEGNVGNEVKNKSYKKDNKNISGYGKPDWNVIKDEDPKDEPKPTPAPKPQQPAEAWYKVTATHGLRLRKGAGLSYPIIMLMPKGTSFVCSKTFGDWAYGKAFDKEGKYLGNGYAHMKWLKKT